MLRLRIIFAFIAFSNVGVFATPGEIDIAQEIRAQEVAENLIDSTNFLDPNLESALSKSPPLQNSISFKGTAATKAQLTASIQLGLQVTINSLPSQPNGALLSWDLKREISEVKFPKEGSVTTPQHSLLPFTFKTYFPTAFHYFRHVYGITSEDYITSLCKSKLTDYANPAKSTSLFFFTADERYIIKTVKDGEIDHFIKEGDNPYSLLYAKNLVHNRQTLLSKFFGIYCYEGSPRACFIVMNNVIAPGITIHEKYDLKALLSNRRASDKEKAKRCPTWQDWDLKEHHSDGLRMLPSAYHSIIKRIKVDTDLLTEANIMDYSLLIGVHNLDAPQGQTDKTACKSSAKKLHKEPDSWDWEILLHRYMNDTRARGALPDGIKLSNNAFEDAIPAWSNNGDRLLLFIGVIDILQDYNLLKIVESVWKSGLKSLLGGGKDKEKPTIISPAEYADRFKDHMRNTVFNSTMTPPRRRSETLLARPLPKLRPQKSGIPLSKLVKYPKISVTKHGAARTKLTVLREDHRRWKSSPGHLISGSGEDLSKYLPGRSQNEHETENENEYKNEHENHQTIS